MVINHVSKSWDDPPSGAPGAAWATTVACYASAVAAWVTVARRPGGPWLPRFPRLLGAAFLGRSAGESKGAL